MTSVVYKSRKRKSVSKPVSFRFADAEECAAFVRLARSKGVSAGELARQLARQALSHPETLPTSSRASSELTELRRALAEALLVLFIKSAGVSQADAVRWFERHWPVGDGGA